MSYLGLDPNTPLLNSSTETFSGNAVALQFNLARSVASASDLDIIVGNVAQRPGIDYTAGNTTLLFTSAPASGTNNIVVTYRGGALNSLDLTATVFNSGTVGAPSVYSLAANNTGIYWANATTMVMTVAGANRATFNGSAASTSNVTGALTVQGGAGISGNVHANGIIQTTNTTESANINSGALQVAGGAGIVGNLNVGGDIVCVGDFTVNGTFTTTGTDSLEVNDPFIFLANANPGDTYDIGVIGQYNDGVDRYTGYFRDITDGKYKLFGNLTERPTTTVDTANASFVFNDLVLANLSATGNVTGTYVLGNGAFLTGVSTGVVSSIVNANSTVIIPAANGNIVNNVNGVTIATVTSGGIAVTGNVSATGAASATGNVTGGNIVTTGNVLATGNISGTGNVTGGNVITGGMVSAIANVTGGNVRTVGVVTATGNVTGGNVVTAGQITATGNVTGGNVLTVGQVSANGVTLGAASGAISGADLSVSGNVAGGNVNSAGAVSATGNVTGGNVTSVGIVNGGTVSSTGSVVAIGNLTGGNIDTAGTVSATGNVTGGNLLAAKGAAGE